MVNKTTKKNYPATCVVHWSTGPVATCDKHARGLMALGNMLGTHVAVTKLTQTTECSNCKSEAGDK